MPSQVHISHRNPTCQSHYIIKHISTYLQLLFNSICEKGSERVAYICMLHEEYSVAIQLIICHVVETRLITEADKVVGFNWNSV